MKNTMQKLEGVFTALVTPLRGGKVDLDQLQDQISFQISSGVSGILPLGTTGEAPTMTSVEKEVILKVAVDGANKQVPVLVGAGTYDTKATCESVKLVEEQGADYVLIAPPYYSKPTQGGILKHYEAIMSSSSIPIIVYNIQGRTGVNIETETLKKLSFNEQIVGVKEASGDIHQMADVINQICSTRPDFSVLSGDDSLTLPLISLGGSGCIAVTPNVRPKEMVSLVSAALAGDFNKARDCHYKLLPLFKALFIESNPIPVKYAMNFLGMKAGESRLPLTELLPQNKIILDQILQNYL